MLNLMDITSDQKYQRLIEMICGKGAALKHELAPNSVIQIECGLEGDDAVELLLMIQEEFQVDFSSFEFQKYFHDEYSMSWGMLLLPIAPLCWAFMRVTKTGMKVDITVQDLYNSIAEGKWTSPERLPKYPWERQRRLNH